MTAPVIERATYSTRDIQRLLGRSQSYVLGLLEQGIIPAHKINNSWIIPKTTFHKWFDNPPAKPITQRN